MNKDKAIEIIYKFVYKNIPLYKLRKEYKISQELIDKYLKMLKIDKEKIIKENTKKTILKYQILKCDLNGNEIKRYNSYQSIIDELDRTKILGNKETIKSEIYDAVAMRRGQNKKYGFIWKREEYEDR